MGGGEGVVLKYHIKYIYTQKTCHNLDLSGMLNTETVSSSTQAQDGTNFFCRVYMQRTIWKMITT